jgi:hypothetical protein
MVARAVSDNLYRFVMPAVAGPHRLVSLAALATKGAERFDHAGSHRTGTAAGPKRPGRPVEKQRRQSQYPMSQRLTVWGCLVPKHVFTLFETVR